MKKSIMIPILVLILASLACSVFTTPQRISTATPRSLQLPGKATSTPFLKEETATAEETLFSADTPAPDTTEQLPTETELPPFNAQATPTPALCAPCTSAGGNDQPAEIKGGFHYTNDILTTYYVENAVALVDFYGFVKRNHDWNIPINGQTLGYMQIDTQARKGTFDLALPERPAGTLVNVDPKDSKQTGVQVFVMTYWPNLTGGPYSEGDDPSKGWPSYLTSVVVDSGNKNEVLGGKLVIWSPDAIQSFPSDFGSDKLLFTADDPVMPVPAGYSIIDLDQHPFAILRQSTAEMTLYEPRDVAIKDFSAMSYTEAFKNLLDTLKKQYAFNGFADKEPDWNKLDATLSPRVAEAQQKNDPVMFANAIRDFTLAFKDGHTGVSGDVFNQIMGQKYGSGYGMALRELDDKRVIVVDVLAGGPADKAGVKVGAEVTKFGGKPINDAINAVTITAPESTDVMRRYQQVRLLMRAPLGQETSVTFKNSGAAEQTVKMKAVREQESYTATSPYKNLDENALPVSYEILPEGVGYIKIGSNYDDLNLIIRLFERALKVFKQNDLSSVIIDMRENLGGSNLGLAGFLYDKEIPMGQLQYYSEKTGKFEAEGELDKIIPNQTQYSFKKIVLLVDLGCASACELEAYGFSQVPGTVVMGAYPSSGTEAEVSRGQFILPDGISLQAPTGRFLNADGTLFLEGKGVQPTIRIPITSDLVLTKGDAILAKAVEEAQK